MGPLGSGKTVAAVERLLLHMVEQEPNADGIRPTRFFVVRNTYSDLETTTIKDHQALFRDGELGRIKMGKPPTYKANFKLPDGTMVESEHIFLALDRDEDVRKLRGAQATGFLLNEAKELEKAIVNMADARHGRFPSMADGGVLPTWHGMWGDTNAPHRDSWYYHMAEEQRPKGWHFFRQPGGVLPALDPVTGDAMEGEWELNPAAENLTNLLPDYYEALLEGKESDWISVMLSNEYGFVNHGKPIHSPPYIDSIHCAKSDIPFRPDWPLTVGIDFGRTPAASFSQRDPVMDRRYVIDEVTTEDMSAALFGPYLKRYIDQNYNIERAGVSVWGDPSGADQGQQIEATAIKILNNAGIPCRPTDSNAPLLRRAALATVINRNCMDGKSAFLLSPKCRMTRQGLMGGYCYKRMKIPGTEQYSEQPLKNEFSHIIEALEYAFQGDGEGKAVLRRHAPPGGHRGQPVAHM
jgi:hypothetical protein